MRKVILGSCMTLAFLLLPHTASASWIGGLTDWFSSFLNSTSISSIHPSLVAPGDDVRIKGTNLSKENTIVIEGNNATTYAVPYEADPKGRYITFVVPELQSGEFAITLRGDEYKGSKVLSLNVVPPEIPYTIRTAGNDIVAPTGYISRVSPPSVYSGSIVVVRGVKLKSTVSKMVNICNPTSCGNYSGNVSADGSTLTFTMPKIPEGKYSLQIIRLVATGHSTPVFPLYVIPAPPVYVPPPPAPSAAYVPPPPPPAPPTSSASSPETTSSQNSPQNNEPPVSSPDYVPPAQMIPTPTLYNFDPASYFEPFVFPDPNTMFQFPNMDASNP